MTTFGDLAQSISGAIVAAVQGVVWRIGRKMGAAWVRGLPPAQLRLFLGDARAGNAKMLGGVIDFQHKRAHDVMRPRTEIVALSLDSTEDEVRAVLRTERYSRYPVFRDSLDDVIGVFVAKDLWALTPGTRFELEAMIREAVYVPASVPAERVLNDLRRKRQHLAIVLDEYGGTAGIVTMEDLIEPIIGDIADEDEPAVRRSFEFEGVLELAGNLSLIDVRSEHHLDIPDGEWTTIGGYAFAKLGRVPKLGDRVPFPAGELEVIAIEGRRVAALRVLRVAALLFLVATGANAQYPTPTRPVAPIVSPTWHVNEAARDAQGEVDTVIARLHMGDTTTVADIGAGSGYYTVRLAKHVAHVYAEDVTPSYVTALQARVDSAHLHDVTVTLGDTADPHLPAGSIDVALLVHMYHEVSQPYGLMAHICAALKPGGRVAIVDLDRDILSHGTPRAVLERELTAMGYHEQSFSRLGQAYLAVFTSRCGTTSK